MCPKIFIRESLLNVRKFRIKSQRQNPRRARGPTAKFGKRRRSIARNYAKSVILKNAIRALPDLRKGHKTKPCNKERCARRVAWDLARSVHKLKNQDKTRLHGSCQHPLRKSQRSENSRSIPPGSCDGGHGQRGGANKRGSTSIRSRP